MNPNYNKGTETALDRVLASYRSAEAEDNLSAKDKELKEQLEAAHGLLTNYHSMEQSVPLLMGRYSISKATAYRRLTDAIRLFGDVTRSYKDGIRHILYEFSMKVFQLAATSKPPDLKAMNGAIKNMALLKGLDKDDGNALTPDVLANKTFVLNIAVGGPNGETKSIALGDLNKIDAGTYAQVIDAVEQSDVSLEKMRGLLLEASEEEKEADDED